ncbi:ADP-ribosyltransferase [Methanobrevibacter sp.]|uniref:ADP-ribosyltransferase n=1 Tax=Methanobrevibacter sp. TaxID=66852 RepID=UPI0038909B4D
MYHSDSLLSTSISKNVKPEKYGDYLSYIVIPKGTKIFYIERITATRGDLEILFSRNKNLKFIQQEDEFISHWKLI